MISRLGFLPVLLFLFSMTGILSVFAYENAQITWFDIANAADTMDDPDANPQPGACGQIHYNSEYVCAVAYQTFDSYPGATDNPNDNPMCGQNLQLTYGDKSVIVTVVDRCASCNNPTDIDLSPTAFQVLGDMSIGRLYGGTWELTTGSPGPVTGDGSGVGVNVNARQVDENTLSPRFSAVQERRMARRQWDTSVRSLSHKADEEPVARREIAARSERPITPNSAVNSRTPEQRRELERRRLPREAPKALTVREAAAEMLPKSPVTSPERKMVRRYQGFEKSAPANEG